jgi:hypothetical protein
MQNRFVGDIGDFGKYGLLNFICRNGEKSKERFRLGINWYLFQPDPNDREMRLDHGNFIGYLKPSRINEQKFRTCDPNLYCKLQTIVDANIRKVSTIEKINILPSGTCFFSKLISYNYTKDKENRLRYRDSWIDESLNMLSSCNLIFYDPDNGIEIESVKKHHKRAGKYVFYDEISNYYNKCKSLIIYNHRSMEENDNYLRRFRKISERIAVNTKIYYLRFHRFNVRDYVFIPQQKHEEILLLKVEKFLSSEWGRQRHFTGPHFL